MALINVEHATIQFNIPDEVVAEFLDRLSRMEGKIDTLMATVAEFEVTLGRINTATTDIASDLAALKDLVATGMSAADVATVKAGMDSAATALEAVAAEFPAAPTPPA